MALPSLVTLDLIVVTTHQLPALVKESVGSWWVYFTMESPLQFFVAILHSKYFVLERVTIETFL